MAGISSSIEGFYDPGTYVFDLPPHKEGDLIYLVFAQRGGGAPSFVEAEGFSLYDAITSANIRITIFQKIALSDNEPNPEMTVGTLCTSLFISIRGVDTSDPVVDTVSGNLTGVVEFMDSLSSPYEDNFILTLFGTPTGTSNPFIDRNRISTIIRDNGQSSPSYFSAFTEYFKDSGTIPPITVEKQRTGVNYNIVYLRICFKNNSESLTPLTATNIPQNVFSSRRPLNDNLMTFVDLDVESGLPFNSLLGLPIDNPTGTITLNILDYLPYSGFFNPNLSGFSGVIFNKNYNITEDYYVTFNPNRSGGSHPQDKYFLSLIDSNDNYKVYLVSSIRNASFPERRVFSKLSESPVIDSSGSLDFSDIQKVVFLGQRSGTSGSSSTVFSDLQFFPPLVEFIGGDFLYPINALTLMNTLTSFGNRVTNLQGVTQLELPLGIKIGNGLKRTVFNNNLNSFTNFSSGGIFWISDSSDIVIEASSDDSIVFDNSILINNNNAVFEILSSSSVDANYSFNSCTFKSFKVVWNSAVCNNASFVGCLGVDASSGSFVNCQFSDQQDTYALSVDNGVNVTNCSFSTTNSSNVALRIEEPGEYDLTGSSFNGYDVSIDVIATSGVVEILLSGNDPIPSFITAGASVVFVTPPASVTVNGLEVGTRIQLYNVNTEEEIVNTVTTDSIFSFVVDDEASDGDVIRLRAMKIPKMFIEVVALFSGANGAGFLVEQSDDQVYLTNDIDGSSVTTVTIDDDNLLVSVDTGVITWGEIYAYESYWLTTEEGIRDEGRFIDARDVANYIFYDFRIKNVSSPSEPLVITGGYGVDSVTNESITLLDTSGGTIFTAPDHAIPVLVNVTTGSVITGDISEVPGAVWTHNNRTLTETVEPDSKEDIYNYFTTSNRQDTFKADVSNLATQSSVNNIPTNPLLSDDSRLDNLDTPISTRSVFNSYSDEVNVGKVKNFEVVNIDDFKADVSDLATSSQSSTIITKVDNVQNVVNDTNDKIDTLPDKDDLEKVEKKVDVSISLSA